MLEIKEKYGDDRRTAIDMTAIDYIEDESLIPNEDILITLTNKGYIKRIPKDTFKVQNRGGVGIKGVQTNEEDYPEKLLSLKSHDYVLLFSNYGKVYRLKGYEIPEYGRTSKGLPIINLIEIDKDERITSVLTVSKEEENKFLFFTTKRGLVKRTQISEFDSIRNNGKKAIILKEDDELVAVRKTDGTKEIIIGASNGKAVRFIETEIRVMGRGSSGVKGIELGKDDIVIGSEDVNENEEILIVTENGYGKKTGIENYRLTHRGSKGVATLKETEKNGKLVALRGIIGEKDVLIVSDTGITIRIKAQQISTLGRNTQGVKLINLKDDQKVSTVAILDVSEELEEETELKDEETVVDNN